MLKAWVVGARSGEALRGFARCGRDVRCLEDGVCLAGDKQFVRSQSVNGWSWSNFAGRVIDSCVRLNGPLDLSAITSKGKPWTVKYPTTFNGGHHSGIHDMLQRQLDNH